MKLFDRYVVVDWSAKNSAATGKDSIWIADLGRRGVTTFSNPPTRRIADEQIRSLLDAGPADRTLLAVDVSLGFPGGSAARFGLEGDAPWRAMWTTLERGIVDDDRNRNNRFEVAAKLNRRTGHAGPFWGRPGSNELDGLTVTKPPSFPDDEFRSCDRLLMSRGYRPASPWQLLGIGSVGSQSLTLIPILERLRRERRAHVWPFTTGLRPPVPERGGVVIAEIWPTLFPMVMPVHWIRDAAQVHGVARRLATADRAGELASWFTPAVDDAASVQLEEGWMLGVATHPGLVAPEPTD